MHTHIHTRLRFVVFRVLLRGNVLLLLHGNILLLLLGLLLLGLLVLHDGGLHYRALLLLVHLLVHVLVELRPAELGGQTNGAAVLGLYVCVCVCLYT
jgi:hypothetical protein